MSEKIEMTQEEFDAKVNDAVSGKIEAAVTEATRKANGEAADFRHRLKEFEDAEAARKLEESTDIAELKEKLGDTTSQVEALTGKLEDSSNVINGFLDAAIEEIPEDKRGLVPDLSAPQKLDWIQQAKTAGLFAKAGVKPPPAGDAGDGDDGEVTSRADLKTAAEKAKYINKNGREKYLALPAT